MKTVQDYLGLGLVFVGDDELLSETNNKDSEGISMSRCWLTHNRYDGCLEVADGFFANKGWAPLSFAWRNNDGVKPEYKGVIEVELNSGQKCTSYVSEITWIRGFGSSVAKWRPVVSMCNHTELKPRCLSDDARKEVQEKFLSALYADSAASKNVWNAIREQFSLPSAIDPAELRESFKLIKEKYLTKEDKPMKPVYTAEMHAKGELPTVGSEFMYSRGGDFQRGIMLFNDGITLLVCLSDSKANRWHWKCEDKGLVFKPITKTIKVNGFDVPAPMSESPENMKVVYLAHTAHEDFNFDFIWQASDTSVRWLYRGLVHSTKSAAIAHAKAMLGIDPNA